jgi:putative membrane protein
MRRFIVAIATATALVACGGPSTPDFVAKVAVSDMYEVQAGKLAAEKGQSEAIKSFGQQMVEAHTKTSEELLQIVKSKDRKINVPASLDAKHEKMLSNLKDASPEDFDETYAEQQVDAHQNAVDVFEDYASSGDDPELKQFAGKTLPVIKHHLEDAKKLPST